jgi:GTP-binding protein
VVHAQLFSMLVVTVDASGQACSLQPPFVATQLDNKKKEGPSPAQNIRTFKTLLSEQFERLPWCFETSSKTGAGRTELLGYLSSVRQLHVASGNL